MRVKYLYSSRRTGRIENMRKQRQKFPEILQKVIEISDIILEILDARFIEETRNEEVEKFIRKSKKRIIYVINKSDLIEKKEIPKSLRPYVLVSAKNKTGISDLRDRIKIEAREVKKNPKHKFDRIHAGVIGYPNTGKSSLINLLIGKKSAGTGAEAGFTKGIQKLKLTSEILFLDSPGVIPTEKYSHTDAKQVSEQTKVGARTTGKIRDPETTLVNLMESYGKQIENHYKIEAKGDTEILLEDLGKRKNFLKKKGEIDHDKTARFILKEWQEGKIKI